MRKISLTLLLASLLSPLFSAKADYTDTSTAIFNPMFRTLTATLDGDLMTDPVLELGSQRELTFSFDEINPDRSYLRCRIIHCNADWQPSRLVESEYADGFNFAEIEDFGFSSNTFVRYVNYRFTIGRNGLQPLASGNYLWQVYDEDDPDTTLLQARFRVSEKAAFVSGEATSRTDAGFNTEFQQVNLAVNTPREVAPNPFADIIVEVQQNRRPDTARFIDHPFRVEGETAIYEHVPDLIFRAGNEYRRFETVRNDYPGMGVDSTRYEEPLYHAWLATSEPRAEKGYVYDSTQRGRFKIDEYNATDPDLGADYIMTHFCLDYPEIMDGDIFVEGDLSLRGYTENNRMKYDRQSGLYHLDIPLKQGSYNYQYVVRKKQTLPDLPNIGGNLRDADNPAKAAREASASIIEGDKFETVNEYNIYVWLRLPGARADRLIGTATLLSNR